MIKTNNSTNIIEVQKEDVVILRITGKLNAPLSQELEKKVFEHINESRINILLNLHDVKYINSAGLRTLLSVKKQLSALGGKFKVCELSNEVMEIMKICGFDHVLDISSKEDEALSQYK
jgi:anti-anti-sigma factor